MAGDVRLRGVRGAPLLQRWLGLLGFRSACEDEGNVVEAVVKRTFTYLHIAEPDAGQEPMEGVLAVEPEMVVDKVIGSVAFAGGDLDVEDTAWFKNAE
jgi:hypothetical protein